MQNHNQGIKKKVILSTTNDLEADQRLHKVAGSLQKFGYDPLLVGFGNSKISKLEKRSYSIKLLHNIFAKGPLFYAEFNIRMFFFLLVSKAEILLANDLDSLLANYLAYRIKRLFGKKVYLVYDSHELFAEVPELNGRPFTKNIWLAIEKCILPKLKNSYTVCQPIADYYQKKYEIKMQVVRNMPLGNNEIGNSYKPNFNIPRNKKIILYQGAINIGRGIEQVIDIMPFINNAVFVIAGTGTIERQIGQRVIDKNLSEKVFFLGKLPFQQLNQITNMADVGLVLQDDISLSYHYVLPNRLFDFIKAGVPIIASDLPEIKKIVEKEGIGLLINGLDEPDFSNKINELLNNSILINSIKQALNNCLSRYCWENEENILRDIFQNLRN